MNSSLSSWVQMRAHVQDNATYKHFLGLKTMAKMLEIPECDALIAQHHNAGADAHIACLIYGTVLRIVDPDRDVGSPTTTDDPGVHMTGAMVI